MQCCSKLYTEALAGLQHEGFHKNKITVKCSPTQGFRYAHGHVGEKSMMHFQVHYS